MRVSLVRLAKKFGELSKLHGIVIYRLSPYELKTFPNIVSHLIPNTLRRMKEASITVLPFFIVLYFILAEAEKENIRQQRKNPADYENDV